MEASEMEKPLVKDLNEHIVCPLCRGYLIDATTLECLHSFCRGCIVRRLSSGARACPVCNVATSPPLLPDVKLQRLVYLVVPGLFRSELERRRHFRLVNPQCPPLALPLGALDLTLDDFVSLSLCELDEPEEEARDHQPESRAGSRHRTNADRTKRENAIRVKSTRYLKCPAGVTVRHLVRLLMLKRGWKEANSPENTNKIEILSEKGEADPEEAEEIVALDQSWTMLDLACIFGWKREAPMKLYYRVVKEDVISVSTVSPYNEEDAENSKDTSGTMENIQRPPTPPPSPKPPQECEVEARRILESSTEPLRSLETNLERDKEPKVKKPRCEVTPVIRTPDLVPIQTSHAPEGSKTKDLARLEHRKHRKRRNKRVIAEITTPREDLLKLKFRLTPCPPRITSSGGGNPSKEKLLQMRAVRREKIKATAIGHQRSTGLEGAGTKENIGKTEETIEEIIDCIPDEVVRIAQNITAPGKEATSVAPRVDQRAATPGCRPSKKEETVSEPVKPVEKSGPERPKKDEEILRRLGLVSVVEAGDKAKQRLQSNVVDKADNLDREQLEKQIRESKANRMRSLLAEKQMRDALKIMSKSKDEHPAPTPAPAPPPVQQVNNNPPKKKGPPPLAPLRVAKPSGFATSSAILEPNNSKYEIPLDLSSGGTIHGKILDLSANLPTINFSTSPSSPSSSSPSSSSSFSSSSSSSFSSSSSSSSSSPSPSSCSVPPLNSRPPILLSNLLKMKPKDPADERPLFPLNPRSSVTSSNLSKGKVKDSDQRRNQDSNLMTLSNAAVSLLSGCAANKESVDPLVLSSANLASKVALRIPQPHQRISGFGMKIKPNQSIRHIPNPQAVVASQYRNQRVNYFNTASQQPP